jgi:hypothetical protein
MPPGKIGSALAAFEANIAKSDGSTSKSFLGNLAKSNTNTNSKVTRRKNLAKDHPKNLEDNDKDAKQSHTNPTEKEELATAESLTNAVSGENLIPKSDCNKLPETSPPIVECTSANDPKKQEDDRAVTVIDTGHFTSYEAQRMMAAKRAAPQRKLSGSLVGVSSVKERMAALQRQKKETEPASEETGTTVVTSSPSTVSDEKPQNEIVERDSQIEPTDANENVVVISPIEPSRRSVRRSHSNFSMSSASFDSNDEFLFHQIEDSRDIVEDEESSGYDTSDEEDVSPVESSEVSFTQEMEMGNSDVLSDPLPGDDADENIDQLVCKQDQDRDNGVQEESSGSVKGSIAEVRPSLMLSDDLISNNDQEGKTIQIPLQNTEESGEENPNELSEQSDSSFLGNDEHQPSELVNAQECAEDVSSSLCSSNKESPVLPVTLIECKVNVCTKENESAANDYPNAATCISPLAAEPDKPNSDVNSVTEENNADERLSLACKKDDRAVTDIDAGHFTSYESQRMMAAKRAAPQRKLSGSLVGVSSVKERMAALNGKKTETVPVQDGKGPAVVASSPSIVSNAPQRGIERTMPVAKPDMHAAVTLKTPKCEIGAAELVAKPDMHAAVILKTPKCEIDAAEPMAKSDMHADSFETPQCEIDTVESEATPCSNAAETFATEPKRRSVRRNHSNFSMSSASFDSNDEFLFHQIEDSRDIAEEEESSDYDTSSSSSENEVLLGVSVPANTSNSFEDDSSALDDSDVDDDSSCISDADPMEGSGMPCLVHNGKSSSYDNHGDLAQADESSDYDTSSSSTENEVPILSQPVPSHTSNNSDADPIKRSVVSPCLVDSGKTSSQNVHKVPPMHQVDNLKEESSNVPVDDEVPSPPTTKEVCSRKVEEGEEPQETYITSFEEQRKEALSRLRHAPQRELSDSLKKAVSLADRMKAFAR